MYGQSNYSSSRTDGIKSEIKDCKNNYLINAKSHVGGICGYGRYAIIDKCCNLYTVNGESYVGGISGYGTESNIKRCYNIVDINVDIQTSERHEYVGGIVSCLSPNSIIEDCYNTGNIYNTGNYTGGITGCLTRQSKIYNCYNAGNVQGAVYSEQACGIGGITTNTYATNDYPEVMDIKYCYNVGNISEIPNALSTETKIGGIIGWIHSGATNVEQCYNSGVISVLSNKATTTKAGGIVGVINNAAGTTVTNVYEKGASAIGQNNASAANATLTGINVNVGSNMPSILSVVNGNGHDAFVEDTNNINNAYPILKWQVQ